MSRRNRKSDGPSIFATLLSALLIAAVVTTIALIAYFNWSGKVARAALDPNTLCPKEPVAIYAVLVDRTDPLSEIQAEGLRRRLEMWSNEVPKHGYFKVYEVGTSAGLLRPVVSVCNPGDGSDVSELTSNRKMWQRRYASKFSAPIGEMINGMRTDATATASPIFEAIQAIAVENFGPDSKALDRKLIVVTDLLQYTPDFNLYKNAPDVDAFRKSPYGKSISSDLSAVGVEIDLLNRKHDAQKQNDSLINFWVQWFHSQGATVEKFTHIPG